jgi:molecular chaperone GrpE
MSGEETLADRSDDADEELSPRDEALGETGAEPPDEQDGEPVVAISGDDGSTDGFVVDVFEDEEDEVARLTAERDEYLDTLRRLQAEFDNYRKRTARQQAEVSERASEAVIARLLPALDALDLALAHVGDRAEPGASELESAFVQIGSLLRDVLAKEGLERIDSNGVAFDPVVHDAVAHVPADGEDGAASGRGETDEPSVPAVVETLRAGYRLKGRVLRPAMVKVRA